MAEQYVFIEDFAQRVSEPDIFAAPISCRAA